MARTQVVCLHEGQKGRSIDPVFINSLIKSLNPNWIRPFKGSNRLENWIQYLIDGVTDENVEGPRVKHNKTVAEAARKLAGRCQNNQVTPALPASLEWSCRNWRELANRMRSS